MANHRIARQTLEIAAADTRAAQAFADEAAAAAPMLAEVIARRLDALDDGRRHRIDRLELTLPPLGVGSFKARLAEALDAALARALPGELAWNDPADPVDDAFALLAAFAETGVLEWWAAGDRAALGEAAKRLARDGTRQIDQLRLVLAAAHAAARLARQLPSKALAALTARLAGQPAEAVNALIVSLVARHPEPDPALAARHAWGAVLSAAATPQTSMDGLARAAAAMLGLQPIASPGDADRARAPEMDQHAAADEPLDSASSGRQASAPAPGAGVSQPAAIDRGAGDGAEGANVEGQPPRLDASHPVENAVETTSAPSGSGDAVRQERPAAERDDGGTSVEAPTLTGTAGAREGTSPAGAPMRVSPRGAGAGQPSVGAAAEGRRSHPPFEDVEGPAAPTPDRPRAAADPRHDTIAIEHAGAVLLAPFLPSFFASLGLFGPAGFFASPAAAGRAAALIDHLATEDWEPPETRLPLAKLLAGLPPEAVLEPQPAITEVEAAEAALLLEAVVAQLPMLGRLSPRGLREAWLARPGVLGAAHGAWLLRVERRPFDMLLDRLPWDLSVCHLPWMPDALRVEW